MLNKEVKPVWLASYPKSGNTWIRLFYTALTASGEVDINDMSVNAIASSRQIIDSALGIYSSHIPQDDILPYRTQMYHQWASKFTDREFFLCKVHDACMTDGRVLFPTAITRGVIYVLRNPFDLAASTANHHGISIERAVQLICSNRYQLAGKKNSLNNQLTQYLGSWSNHVTSWTNVHRNNLLIVRYENLLNDSLAEFSKLTDYLELKYSTADIQSAISKTSFENIKAQETLVKFREHVKAPVFFRSGKVGGWRQELTKDQVNLIIDSNYEVLLKHKYIDATGNVLV